METLRVLHIFGKLNIGGAETMIMNLYRAVDRDRIQFDFVVHAEGKGAYDDEVTDMGGRIYHCPRYRGWNHAAYMKWWKRFFEEHDEFRAVHSHIRSTASLYLPIASAHGIPTIIHSHSTSNGSGISSLVKKILQYPLRKRADYFFGCSEEAGKWLFGEKIVGSDRYFMVKNSVDAEAYRFDPEIRASMRNELELGEHRTYLHVGRFHPAKNHMFLLDVFAHLLKAEPDALLLLAGDGDLRGEIESRIRELGIESSVRLLGVRRDVEKVMQAADVFLFPSQWEGLPVTVVEAQASGLPCLMSDHVTSDVVITDLIRKLSVDNGPEVWTDAIAELNRSPVERTDRRQEIRDSGFDTAATAEWLTEFYLNAKSGRS